MVQFKLLFLLSSQPPVIPSLPITPSTYYSIQRFLYTIQGVQKFVHIRIQQRNSFRNILNEIYLFFVISEDMIFAKSVIEVEYMCYYMIIREYLKHWTEGNDLLHVTGTLMTAHIEDADSRTCPTKDVHQSTATSHFTPSFIQLLGLFRPSQCLCLHRRKQTQKSACVSLEIRTHDINIWKIGQITHLRPLRHCVWHKLPTLY
jgi:hypothetical protein